MAKRYRRREKKPINKSSLIGTVIGFFCILFFVMIITRIRSGNTTGVKTAAVSVLAGLMSIASLVEGIVESRKTDYANWCRLLGVVVPLASTLLYGSVYILGIIH